MNLDWKIWALGGAGLLAAFMVLRKSAPTTSSQNLTGFQTDNLTTPVGQSYQYLDGTGMQHLVATDPNGALTYYQTMPPGTSMDESGQMSSYVGMMSHYTTIPMMGYTPYYSMTPTQNTTNVQ